MLGTVALLIFSAVFGSPLKTAGVLFGKDIKKGFDLWNDVGLAYTDDLQRCLRGFEYFVEYLELFFACNKPIICKF